MGILNLSLLCVCWCMQVWVGASRQPELPCLSLNSDIKAVSVLSCLLSTTPFAFLIFILSLFLSCFDAFSVLVFFWCIQCFGLLLTHSVCSVSSRDIFIDLWENGLCNHLIGSNPTTDCPPDWLGQVRHWTPSVVIRVTCLTPSLPQPVQFQGWKLYGSTSKQYIFPFYNTSTFSAMHFDENPFTCQCKKENKKAEGF